MAKIVFDARDVEKNRLVGAIGYILFFVPLLVDNKSHYNRFCANQGILGWIAYAAIAIVFGAINFLLGWLPLIGWLLRLTGSLVKLAIIAVMLYYGWNAYNGKADPLPYIGAIELFR